MVSGMGKNIVGAFITVWVVSVLLGMTLVGAAVYFLVSKASC